MPPARHTSAARAIRTDDQVRHSRAPKPRQVTRQLPTSKVGWDRKFRIVMVVVFAVAAWMAVKAGVAVFSAHSQAAAEAQLVQKYSRENHRLEHQAASLHQRKTILQHARELGMVRHGEKSYVITGLPAEGN